MSLTAVGVVVQTGRFAPESMSAIREKSLQLGNNAYWAS